MHFEQRTLQIIRTLLVIIGTMPKTLQILLQEKSVTKPWLYTWNCIEVEFATNRDRAIML